jgi:hypothetical protein
MKRPIWVFFAIAGATGTVEMRAASGICVAAPVKVQPR